MTTGHIGVGGGDIPIGHAEARNRKCGNCKTVDLVYQGELNDGRAVLSCPSCLGLLVTTGDGELTYARTR